MGYDAKRGFRSLLSAKALNSVIGLATLPLMIRVLGPESYGDYAFLMSTFGFMMLFVSPSITEGVQKFVAEDRDADDWQAQVLGFYLRLAVFLAVLGSLGVVVGTATGVVGSLLSPEFELFFYFLAAHVIVIQLQNFTRHALLGLGMEPVSESLSVVAKFLLRVLGIALAVTGLGVVGFLVSEIVAASVVIVTSFWFLRDRVDVRSLLRERPAVPRRELLSFNGLNVVTVVLMVSLYHVDVMMLRLLTGGAETGFYKAALVLAEYIWIVPKALESLMIHSASRLWSQERRDRIQALGSRLTRYVFLSTGLLATGIFVLSDSFVPLYYGPDFEAAVLPLMILMPGAVGFALARPLYGINKASSRLLPVVAALAVTAVLNAVCNYLLIPVYGPSGAAVATSLSYGLMFAFQAACALYLGYSPLRRVRPLRLLATVGVAGPAIYLFDAAIGSDLLSLVVVPPVGFLAFTAAALLTGALDVAELSETASLFPGPIEDRIQALVFRLDRN